MVTRILDSVENAAANKPAIDKFITRFARVYTPAVVVAAIVVAVVLPFILPNWHFFVSEGYTGAETVLHGATGTASVLTALTFLVISCPCALVLSVPLAFFSGIGAASKKNILFKGGNVIGVLSGIKAVNCPPPIPSASAWWRQKRKVWMWSVRPGWKRSPDMVSVRRYPPERFCAATGS